MKPTLTIVTSTGCFHFVDGNRIAGAPSDLRGDVTNLQGNMTGWWGDATGLQGNVTGLWGNVTGLQGNVDDCEISDDERKNSVEISSLILKNEPT